MHNFALRLFFAGSFVFSSPAIAQVSVGTFGQWSVQTGLTNVMTSTINNSSQVFNSEPTKAKFLIFAFKKNVSNRVQDEFIARLRQINAGKVDIDEQSIRSENVIRLFKSNVQPYGLRANNLADILTAYMAITWVIVNQAELPKKSEVIALQQSLQTLMVDRFSALTNEQRQYIGETLIYETMLSITARNSSLFNPGKRQQIADSVHQNWLKQGIDFRSIALTEKGFILQ